MQKPATATPPIMPHASRLQRLRRQQWLLGAVCTLLVLGAWRAGLLERLELPTIDLRTQWFNHWAGGPSPDIAVIGIDDRALAEVGDWPWSRDVMADAVEELHKAGARTIALDVIFNSPWTGAPDSKSDPDAALAHAMADHAGVILPFRKTAAGASAPVSVLQLLRDPEVRAILHDLPDPIAARRIAESLQATGTKDATPDAVLMLLPAVRSIIGAEPRSSARVPAPDAAGVPLLDGQIDVPIPALSSAAVALGDVAINQRVAFGADSVYRRMPLWTRLDDDRLWAAFSLAAVAHFLQFPVSEIQPSAGSVTRIPTSPPRLIASRIVSVAGVRYPYVYDITWPRGGRTWGGQFTDPHADPETPSHEIPMTAPLRPLLIRRAVAQNLLSLQGLLQLASSLNLGDFSHGADLVKQLRAIPISDPGWPDQFEQVAAEATRAAHAATDFLSFAGDAKLADLPESQARVYVEHKDIAEKIPAIITECRAAPAQIDTARGFLRSVVSGKLVFVGWTATSIAADAWKTSLATPQTPGVYIHAAVASSMLTGFVRRPVPAWMDAGFVCLLGVAGIAAARRAAVWFAPLLLLALIAAWVLFAGVVLWDAAWKVAAISAPSLAAAAGWLVVLLHRLLVEQRMRRRTEERFRTYVSPAVVDELVNNPQLDSMTPQRRDLTIMFCDLAGFTAIAERLGAEGTAAFLSGYLGRMTDTLLRHGATIDKYLGDGIMAFWGAPIHDPRHARNACRAAAALARAVADPALAGVAAGAPGPLKIRIGLAAGDVMVGDFGNPPIRSSYTVLGDACNIAARLEQACKSLGATILVSASVRAAAGEGFLWRPLGKFILQGRNAPEPVFELVGTSAPGGKTVADEQLAIQVRPGVTAESLGAWIRATEDAVESFAAGRWDDARQRFSALARDYADDALARVYLAAIDERAAGARPGAPLDAVSLPDT